jgi:hypothetical protein
MDELVRWLGEQLDHDEAVARAAGGPWRELSANWVVAVPADGTSKGDHRVAMVLVADERAHIVAHDPARVLREVNAKRQILKMADEATRQAESRDYLVNGPAKMMLTCLQPVLLHLATAYADRPGYREEWRP